MHRIDTPTAQKDKFGAGKNGFTRGNPQTGTPATDLDDDYFDMLQEELAGVVEATGVNLDKSKHNQLLTALKALLLSRAHPFADIKADGTAAIAEALSNLGLVGGLASDAVGRLIGVKIITASTTYAATPGTKKVLAIITGGGGAGGSCSATTTGSTFSGAGGGGGGTCIGLLNLADATNKAITIGAGGAAELAGGSTTFAGMAAGGGGGGGYTSVTSTPGGTSGTATGGIMNIPGGHGGDGQSGAYLISGMGGGSLWGTGGRSGQNAGISSIVYGAGGGGAYDTGFSGTKRNGGNGAPGVAVILEFA
ncbi:carbohydrate kinase [Citrobacter sp. C1]|uniref:carbohydrate kinase n=1 Tax=Citrobacter sp. C1 TaxID=2769343 RepID=UPI0032B5E465